MSVTLVEAPRRRRRRRYEPSERDCLVEGRGLRRSLRAAIRAGRSPMQIASDAGVPTRAVTQLLNGASFATEPLADRLLQVLPRWEKVLVCDARGGHVPASAVMPLVERMVALHGKEWVARRSGVSARQLWALRSGKARTVQFSTADRLVIRLDSPDRWKSKSLVRWYFQSVVGI